MSRTTHQVIPGMDTTDDIVAGLESISRHMQLLLRTQAAEHGLSPLQVNILLFIRAAADAVTPAMLARAFGLSRATVSVAIKPIISKGMISKRQAPASSRSVCLDLTEWGSQIAHVAGFYTEPLRKIVALIGAEDKQVLLRNLEGITERLQSSNAGA